MPHELPERVKHHGSIATLAAIVFVASIPMMMDYLPSAHDLVFHLFRIEGIAEGFAQGQGVVRIQTSQLGGAGISSGAAPSPRLANGLMLSTLCCID